jgi:hypothetical protein
MLMFMEKKMISNDFRSEADIRNEKIIDDMVDEIIESYLNRWDPYDYGR